MNKKMIFRILGALSGALIIVSVFVPFVSVLGYSSSLWDTEKITNSLYLPIVIMSFGAIISILFALNKKIEFAYTGVGAILFYVLTRTIDILAQDIDAFSTLSVGYYFLVIGTIVSGVMVFLMSRLNNETTIDKDIPVSNNVNNDDLFTPASQNTLIESQNQVDQLQPIQTDLNQAIAPTPVNDLNNVGDNQSLEAINPATQSLNQEEKIEPLNDAMGASVEQVQSTNPATQNLVQDTPVDTVNPATQNLVQDTPSDSVNPAPQNLVQGAPSDSVNPTTQNLVQDLSVQPIGTVPSESVEGQSVNPVVQEFSNSIPTAANNFISTPVNSPSVDVNESKLNQESTNNSMDIFG